MLISLISGLSLVRPPLFELLLPEPVLLVFGLGLFLGLFWFAHRGTLAGSSHLAATSLKTVPGLQPASLGVTPFRQT